MEAEATVIKCDTSMTCCLDCHKTQAETTWPIAFKAGYDEGFKDAKNKYDFSSKGCHDVKEYYKE